MSKYAYMGDKAEVSVNEGGRITSFPRGEAVEVSDKLAAKFANNPNFVAEADLKKALDQEAKDKAAAQAAKAKAAEQAAKASKGK